MEILCFVLCGSKISFVETDILSAMCEKGIKKAVKMYEWKNYLQMNVITYNMQL